MAVSGPVTAAPVKLIFPLPDAGRPMAGLSLVQEKVAPAVPLKLTVPGAPAQIARLAGSFTVGAGVTVIVKVCATPVHPGPFGITVIVPVWALATLALVKLISPLPEAPSSIRGRRTAAGCAAAAWARDWRARVRLPDVR